MKLLFYKGTHRENPKATIADRIICFVTRSRFSHVEISTRDYGDGRYVCWTSSARDGGVRCKVLNGDSASWEIVDIGGDDMITNVEQVFNDNWGRKYDYVGLVGTAIKSAIFSDKVKWFCSEICAESLGFVRSWSLSPQSLYEQYHK